MSDFVVDPETGEFYNNTYWSSIIEANKTALTTDWQKTYNATNPTDYYQKNNMIDFVLMENDICQESSRIRSALEQVTE